MDTNGEVKKIKCYTKIFGPGDKKMSPFRCLNVYGTYPVVHWESIYWGAHSQASYGGPVRLRVTEMNFTPENVKRSVCTLLLPPVEESNEHETDYEDLSFESYECELCQ